MTAEQIMNNDAMWQTRERTAYDDYWPSRYATDSADWQESWVLHENALNAQGVMAEAMK